MAALLIGAIGATICYHAKHVQTWLKIDDTLEVWRAHGVGGLTGVILIGFMASSNINKVEASFHQLGVQILAVVIVAVYSWLITTLILKIIDSTGKLRVSDEAQLAGLDTATGESAYSLWGMNDRTRN